MHSRSNSVSNNRKRTGKRAAMLYERLRLSFFKKAVVMFRDGFFISCLSGGGTELGSPSLPHFLKEIVIP